MIRMHRCKMLSTHETKANLKQHKNERIVYPNSLIEYDIVLVRVCVFVFLFVSVIR